MSEGSNQPDRDPASPNPLVNPHPFVKHTDPYEYQHLLDFGYLRVSVPNRVSRYDVEDLERLFALIVRQAKRRAEPDPPAPPQQRGEGEHDGE